MNQPGVQFVRTLFVATLAILAFSASLSAQTSSSSQQQDTRALKQAFQEAYEGLWPSIGDSASSPRTARLPAFDGNSPMRSGVAPVPQFPDLLNPSVVEPSRARPDTPTGNLPPMPAALADVVAQSEPSESSAESLQSLPELSADADAGMWWQPLVIQPLDQRDSEAINPELLIYLALRNSPKILAISQQPLIRETDIGEARADFDPELFLKSQFDDRVDPVGNQLTTGNGEPFLKEHIWYGDAGIRKKLWSGGEIEARQRLGFQNSNSRFFDPQDQGTATLSLNFSQPLLRGRGEAYNRSQIVIAQLSSTASWDQFAAELQDELTAVVDAYWTLYYNRAVLLQKQYNVERGEIVLGKLEGRSGLDSLPSQIARARSAVQSRRTELANAKRDVKNAETAIRLLIGSRDNFLATAPEMLPQESPALYRGNLELASLIEQSMQLRPEIRQALQRAKIASLQKNISQHELLPELNLIFNAYTSALRGETEILGAWVDQFSATTPGYAVGVEFNMPWARRAARSRNRRQQLVLQQVRHDIDRAVNDVVAETQIAWREVDSAWQTTMAAAEAISAARADLSQNEARWETFALVEGDFAEGQTPTTLLDQLLDAQQRLAFAELTYSQAVLEFKRAEMGLKRATGELLRHHEVSAATGYSSPLPGNGSATPMPAQPAAPASPAMPRQ
jgi:outer membrane protein TolC